MFSALLIKNYILVHSNMSFIIGTIFYLSLSLFYLSCEAYDPVDVFSISSGSFGKSTDETNRTWNGDINSKLLLAIESQSVTASALRQSPSVDKTPYSTARLSYSNFTYSFPVTAGQKFIRLYFYPTSYKQGFDRSKALFTVTSGTFTLLKDFNASLNADADSSDTIFREYCNNIDDGQRLNLTFSPSTIQPDFYAFINGIEILSMPTNLYYTDSKSPGFKLAGWSNMFNIANNSALKTEYRLNVGGSYISPNHDTGLLRSWEGDQKYVTTPSALPADYGTGIKLSFTEVPNYTAPDPVYRTGRSMGSDATLNQMSNLTWEFPVNSGFSYMLRLHFCEINPDIKLLSDRVFYIYIDDKLAEDHADVLQWSKQMGVPVYRDYAVPIFGNVKKYNLSLKLQPNQDIRKTAYFDAFLNGIEIFRISDPQSNSLAGPNPDSLPPAPPEYKQLTQNQKKSSRPSILCVVAGVVAGFALLLLLVACFIVGRRRGSQFNHANSDDRTSRWAPFSSTTTKSRSSSLPSDLCRYFSIAEIEAAANNFDELFKVGVGGFGNVYKGYIDDNTTTVAIKRLKPGSQQGAQEFMNEIGMLSQLRHLHLVSLIGYCNENNEMILVYDYMARGTLRDHLYNTDNPPLSWKQRVQICIGAARGLHYLHTGAKQTIIHRDVKSTNILLDEQWVAKVSDFGLSKIGPSGISRSHITTVIKGSFGYLDPDYYTRQRLTIKSDVYAFGVVLLEVLCGRPPLLRSIDKSKICLSDCARKCYQEGIIDQIVDPFWKGRIAPECLKKFSDIAMNCLLDDGSQRPSMNDVVWGLEFALQLQENAEQRDQISSKVEVMERGEIGNEDSDDMFSSSSGRMVSDFNKSSGISMTSSASGEQGAGNKDTDKLMPDSAFEIMDQKAR
ncbi:hypothetical protein L6164_006674 [Bauhinia variegata]|uniref:Uncharacterized protein n=1 Tax=Bauhinia variegata TaxID=167791 RepID=A0ACB9PUI9_BAUVA|nr:hypothetical protein L6164_006674 [Bauhinia variegata]